MECKIYQKGSITIIESTSPEEFVKGVSGKLAESSLTRPKVDIQVVPKGQDILYVAILTWGKN